MIEIDREDLIVLIKQCIADAIWKREQCMTIFSDEDIEDIEEVLDDYLNS